MLAATPTSCPSCGAAVGQQAVASTAGWSSRLVTTLPTARSATGLAEELMTYLGRHPTNGNRCLLQWIVLDMIRQEPRLSELKGIEVGFLSRVGDCFMYVARMREELVPGVIVVT